MKKYQNPIPQWIIPLFLFVSLSTGLQAQNNPKELLQQADLFFENQKFKQAKQYYQSYIQSQADKKIDPDVLLRSAICSYRNNHPEETIDLLNEVVTDNKKVNPKTYLYLGKAHHANLSFQQAVKHYKLYLAEVKDNNANRASIRDAIRRCGNGLKIEVQDKPALVENLGEQINSEYNDFAPVISPNFTNKLYFSSARSTSVGGLRDAQGRRDNIYGKYSSDMYFTTIYEGEWTATTSMSTLLNTPRNDVILDFNSDGSVLYFYKGYNLISGEVFVDTFNTEEERLFPTNLNSPLQAEKGDGRIDVFKDSIIVFDSRRTGGNGGSDLYAMVKRGETWSTPQNLGNTINTAYDETTPFVAADGKTLYFSSNDSRKSIGGMDIFKSVYDFETGEWSIPQNVGLPLNSAQDDLYFSLSVDGLQGYFSSNRKESLGGNDIFVAYFKQVQQAQQAATVAPYTFMDQIQRNNNTTNEVQEIVIQDSTLIQKTYEIEPLYYTDDDDVTNPQNIDRLNTLIRALKDDPNLETLLSCHSDASDPSQFGLYFAIKRAEKAAEYLQKNSIQAHRIHLRGVGANYPIAQNILDDRPNEMGKQLNRRIDIDVFNQSNANILIHINEPNVSQFMVDPKGTQYKNKTKGLTYRVQVATLKQMYKGNLLKEHDDPLIERNMASKNYQYSVGLFNSYFEAKQFANELKRAGNTNVFVVASIGGQQISKEEAPKYSNIYPDLLNFINANY